MSEPEALEQGGSVSVDEFINRVLEGLGAGKLIPYLGPGLTRHSGAAVPCSYSELAEGLGKVAPLPRRARGNAWAAAQYLEQRRHRRVVDRAMSSLFEPRVEPSALLRTLTATAPMVVSAWYDDSVANALSAQSRSWGMVQGIYRGKPGETGWTRAYRADGTECSTDEAGGWDVVLYQPHGSVRPAANFLITDADYVEVLTEIDIQTPIPPIVKARRSDCGYLFVGCRFDDQLLRTYPRQLARRSAGPHFVVVEPGVSTKNERGFLSSELGAVAIELSLTELETRLS